MADVSVRSARPEDADEVARVQLSTWRTAYAHLLPPDALELPQQQVAAAWRRAVAEPAGPRSHVLVALEGTQLVGFTSSAPAEDDDLEAGTTEVTTLLVEPRWGRRGHGSRLLAASVDAWRSDGVRTAVSWAFERDTPTRRFLTSAGWELDGRSRGLDTGAGVARQVRLHVDVSA